MNLFGDGKTVGYILCRNQSIHAANKTAICHINVEILICLIDMRYVVFHP